MLTNKGYKVKIILKPVKLWRESGMLNKFYKGDVYEFQTYAITSPVDIINKEYQDAIDKQFDFIFIETNPLVDLHVYSRSVLSEIYRYFEHWKKETSRLLFDITKFKNLFISVKPELCFNRIKKRDRIEEKTVGLIYLQKLDYEYQILNQVIKPRVISNDGNIYDSDELHNVCFSLLNFTV